MINEPAELVKRRERYNRLNRLHRDAFATFQESPMVWNGPQFSFYETVSIALADARWHYDAAVAFYGPGGFGHHNGLTPA